MFTKSATIGMVALLVLLSCLSRGAPVQGQNAPVVTIKVTQDTEPAECSVGDEVRVRLNFNVSDAEGNPVSLGSALDLPVTMPAFADPDSLLSVAAAEDVFHFGAGFKGGSRVLITAVAGPGVPAEPLVVKPPVTFGDPGPGRVLAAPATLSIQVRSSPAEPSGQFHFCPQPGRGDVVEGMDPLLYTDFKRCLMVGHVAAAGLPAATVLAGIEVIVVERVQNIGDVVQTDITLADALQRSVVDADGDGIAEGITIVARLQADTPVPVAINAKREFEIRVRHLDGAATNVLGEAGFVVRRREETSGPGGVAIVGHDHGVYAVFKRDQSRALNPKLTLLRNGVPMDAAARATATITPSLTNATPAGDSGLYNLYWSVDLDWNRLQKLVPWGAEDVLTFRWEFSASIGSADVNWDLAIPGVNATTFDTPQKLTDKRYDNGRTEKDYFDDLVRELKGAGLRLREQPDRLEFPTLLDNPNEKRPNWDRVETAIAAVKAAVKAYKDAARRVNGADALGGQKEWDTEVEVEFDVVDAGGNPLRNPDGTVKKKLIKVRIVFKPGHDVNGNGSDADGDDKGQGPKVVIVIGQCGKTAANGNNGKGGAAKVKVTGPGSVGVAVAGDGASNTDPSVNKHGGHGGAAKADAGSAKRPAGQPGATGVAIGGQGGDAVAPNTNPGNGGDANAEAAKGGASGVVVRPGDSGNGKLPGVDNEIKSGTGTAENEDALETNGKKSISTTVAKSAKGQGGKAKAGVARAETGKSLKTSPGEYDGNPVTGGN